MPKRCTIDITEFENGGYAVEYCWQIDDEDSSYKRSAKHAHGDQDALVRDVVQFLTETGDWNDEEPDPEAERRAASHLDH